MRTSLGRAEAQDAGYTSRSPAPTQAQGYATPRCEPDWFGRRGWGLTVEIDGVLNEHQIGTGRWQMPVEAVLHV